MNSVENVRRWLCEHFTEKDWRTIEELRNGRETHARHPIVALIHGSRDRMIAQAADLDFAYRAIRRKDRNWAVKGDLKRTLLGKDIANCTSALAEIRARGFLTDTFPDTKKVSKKQGTKTPDFEIPGPKGDFVSIEVHTKLMSQQMHDKMSDFYEGMKDGTIGSQRGKVRVGSIVVESFTGETRGTAMTDAVSK